VGSGSFFGFPSEVGYQPSTKDKDFKNALRREFGDFMKKGSVKTESRKAYPNKTHMSSLHGRWSTNARERIPQKTV